MMTFAWIIVGLFGLLVAAYAYAEYQAPVRVRAPYVPTHRRPEPRDVRHAQPGWDAMDIGLYQLLMRNDIDSVLAQLTDPEDGHAPKQLTAAPAAQPGEYTREEPHACDGGSCGHGFAVTSPGRALALVGQAP